MSEVPRNDQNRSLLSALCGSDCRFWVVFDAIADGIFISDPTTGRFIEINQPGCRMFGYSKSELIGLKIEALSSGVHPYTQDMVIERIEKARLEGPQTFEWHCKTKDEVLFWAEISIHCKQIEQIPAVVAIVRDITKHKQEEQAVRNAALYARSLIEASLNPLSVIGLDGKISDVNEATVRITGVPREAVQRKGGDGMVFGLEGPARGDGRIEDKRHQYFWPSCRAGNSSSTVIFPVRLRRALIASMALSISSCRRCASGTIRAMGRPCRVIMTVSLRSTSSSSWGRCALASEA